MFLFLSCIYIDSHIVSRAYKFLWHLVKGFHEVHAHCVHYDTYKGFYSLAYYVS